MESTIISRDRNLAEKLKKEIEHEEAKQRELLKRLDKLEKSIMVKYNIKTKEEFSTWLTDKRDSNK